MGRHPSQSRNMEHRITLMLLLILPDTLLKPKTYNKLVPLELDPTPTRSRTETDLSRDVGNERDSLGYRLEGFLIWPPRSHRASLSRPRVTCLRVARGADACHGQGVGMPNAKRREKLRIWRPGVANRAGVGARGQRNPGCWRGGAAEFQVFRERQQRADSVEKRLMFNC
jgi:hypothetical protein